MGCFIGSNWAVSFVPTGPIQLGLEKFFHRWKAEILSFPTVKEFFKTERSTPGYDPIFEGSNWAPAQLEPLRRPSWKRIKHTFYGKKEQLESKKHKKHEKGKLEATRQHSWNQKSVKNSKKTQLEPIKQPSWKKRYGRPAIMPVGSIYSKGSLRSQSEDMNRSLQDSDRPHHQFRIKTVEFIYKNI